MVDNVMSFIRSIEKKDPFTGKVKNPTTVNRKAYALSSFFNYLIHVYNYPKNPIKQFQPHKTEKKRNNRGQVLQSSIFNFPDSSANSRIVHFKPARNFLHCIISRKISLCHGFFTTLICFFIPFKSLRNRTMLQARHFFQTLKIREIRQSEVNWSVRSGGK